MSDMSELVPKLLNSDFFIFFVGSMILPFVLAFWEYLKTQVIRKNERERLIRLAILRYTRVQDACEGEDKDAFDYAFNVLSCGSKYRPLDPELEGGLPLTGLVLRLMSRKELRKGLIHDGGRIPETTRLMELEELVLNIKGELETNSNPNLLQKYKKKLDTLLPEIGKDRDKLIFLLSNRTINNSRGSRCHRFAALLGDFLLLEDFLIDQ